MQTTVMREMIWKNGKSWGEQSRKVAYRHRCETENEHIISMSDTAQIY